jgi:tetratricopeptide (TPR) repeat protein
MEAYRLSSKLRENEREYLIQTTNDVVEGMISTTVFVNGVRTDSFSCPHRGDLSPEQMMSLVKQAHGDRKRELETLLRAYQNAIAGGHTEEMYRLGIAFFYRRLYREARDILTGLTRLDPGHHQGWSLLAQACLALGDYAEAVKAAVEAVRLRPGYADYRNNLGEALLADSAVAEAVVELEAALSINMYYGEAYFNLALAWTLEVANCRDAGRRRQLDSRIGELLKKAALILPEFESHTDYRESLVALAAFDYARALGLLKRVRESRREVKRQEFATANRRLVTHQDSWTMDAINDQIRLLEAQLVQHPHYLDLQTELARCQFERASHMWESGVDTCQRILEAHPDVANIRGALERAQAVPAAAEQVIDALSPKG